MSGRSVRGSETSSVTERRSAQGYRVHFEAMVAVGGAEGGAGFEAESVDVSSDGMRLRTAYLPTLGETIVCRFDGPDGEVIALGEVVWITEQTRGGEFAVRFVDLDEETALQLQALCPREEAFEGEPEEAAPAPKAIAGGRVRLHIEGLGSPMKARVRDADARQMAVGSNLEFLKLGRPVEIEDVDQGARREGFVDAVRVEIDPATSVPQLVVSLRFDGAALMAALPFAKTELEPESEAPPEPMVAKSGKITEEIDEMPPATKAAVPAQRGSAAGKRVSRPTRQTVKSEAVLASEAPSDEDEEEIDQRELGLGSGRLKAAGAKAQEFGYKALQTVGPAFSRMGNGAKDLFGSLRNGFEKRKQNRALRVKAGAPRRVTAPPPSGALTSAGRRVVREQGDEEEDAAESVVGTEPKSRRGLMLGAAAGLMVMLTVFGVAKALGGSKEPANAPVAAADLRASEAPPQLPPIPGAPAVADVPLFGATPLSTTEQVPASAPDPKSADGEASDAGEEAVADSAKPSDKELVREWGQGEVSNPRVLKIRLDGPVKGFVATEVEGGFNIIVPGRKSLSTSSALVRKDKRLSALDVISREDATEITVRFKGDAPAYLTKVRSDRIEIALGSDNKKSSEKKVASKSSSKAKKKSKKK